MDAIFDEALESPLERGFEDVRAGHQQRSWLSRSANDRLSRKQNLHPQESAH